MDNKAKMRNHIKHVRKCVQTGKHRLYGEVVLMEGNIVQTLHLDETTIHICDDYCRGKSKEDVEKILDAITKQNLRYLQIKTA